MALSSFRNFVTQTWPPRPTFTEADVPPGSQEGKVFVVTGGNAGIGFEMCKILKRAGAKVYMASRNADKANAAIAEIDKEQGEAGNGRVVFLHLDLGDLQTVRKAAATFNEKESKLDVLWNNAGIGAHAVKYGERTVQDLEPLIGTSCVATLLFTQLVLPKLKAAASLTSSPGSVRVIWLASGLIDSAAPRHGIDFAKLESGHEDRVRNYAAAKAGSWILARELARRSKEDGSGVLSLAVNPGNLKTAVFEGTPRATMAVLRALTLRPPVFGAYTELWAGLSGNVKPTDSGSYVIPWGRLRGDGEVQRQDVVVASRPEGQERGLGYGERLWEWCESQAKARLLRDDIAKGHGE